MPMHETDLLTRVAGAMETSSLIEDQTNIRNSLPDGSVLFEDTELKTLSSEEIRALEGNLNSASDWSLVRVAPGFDPGRVREARFIGRVILGRFTGESEVEKGITIPTGIFRSLISNSEIGNDAVVHEVRILGNMIVKDRAVILNCGSVICSGTTTFGNGIELPVAIETGGREVKTYAEITLDVAAEVAASRGDGDKLAGYDRLIMDYSQRAGGEFGMIGELAVVRNTPRVENSYVGDHCCISDAVLVRNSTLLGTEEEPSLITDGAFVRDSILQWGAEVTTGAIVDRSVLTEHSHVERHGKVTDSLLGPNSGVGEGEVTASLVGPFVGFHHQALLIAAFWPEGKGNVGYGANVGSNHTSKAPDQEIWPGEGTFFGLGVNIKFPSDFTLAPYSIIATAVNALPQKVTFPFSLINSPAETVADLSPAYNEIMPAWVLSDNIFTVKRNEGKYRKRNKARRSEFDFEVFRPDIMDLVMRARGSLEAVEETKDFYTDRDIAGLGKNYLREDVRLRAIETYAFYLRYYALSGLKRELTTRLDASEKVDPEELFQEESPTPRWAHERELLLAEGYGKNLVSDLKEFLKVQEAIAQSVQVSKEKDDVRGALIIDDYPAAHPPAGEDDFVVETWKEFEELKREVEELITRLG